MPSGSPKISRLSTSLDMSSGSPKPRDQSLPYECSICLKAFKYKILLRNHFKLHSKERGTENCNCLFSKNRGKKEEIIVDGSDTTVKFDLSKTCKNLNVVYVIGKIDNIIFYSFLNVGKK